MRLIHPMALAAALLALSACAEPTAAPSDDSTAAAPEPTNTGTAAPQGIVVGALAPDFELPGSDGQTHRLSDYAGQHVVLSFFPKAFTGG